MWTSENRARYNRDHLRYPSDTTEEEWTELGSLIPPARRGGRKRTVNMREVLNGLLSVLSTGCRGERFPKSSRRGVRSVTTLGGGRPMGRYGGCLTHGM